jgi:hypothetical protein
MLSPIIIISLHNCVFSPPVTVSLSTSPGRQRHRTEKNGQGARKKISREGAPGTLRMLGAFAVHYSFFACPSLRVPTAAE